MPTNATRAVTGIGRYRRTVNRRSAGGAAARGVAARLA